jgi:LPXTG-motif cell wall-anchored protein
MREQRARRTFASVALGIGVVLLGIGAAPGIASAHNASHNVGCGGISWSAQNYDGGQTNSIVVRVDGAAVYSDASFGTTDTGSRTWTQTVDHTWSIVVDAPGSQYDYSRSGTQVACQPPPTTAATTTTTTTTTTQPEVTTTQPEVTTTQPEVTTTLPGDTTTTVAASTSTTVVSQAGPTTSVGQSSGVATTTVPVERTLPATGSDSSTSLVVIALTTIGIGAVMLRFASKPSR